MPIPSITQSNLIDFERVRKELNYIPNENEEAVFEVGRGVIILKNTPKDNNMGTFFPSLELNIYNRTVDCGFGEFNLQGFIFNYYGLYYSVHVDKNAIFNIQDRFILSAITGLPSHHIIPPEMVVDGTMNLLTNSNLIINNGSVLFSKDSKLKLYDKSHIIIDVPENDYNHYVYIHGELELDFSNLYEIINNKNIFIADDVHIQVSNIPTNRYMSISDFISDLNKQYQNINSAGIRNLSNTSRVSYKWKAGSPSNQTDILSLSIEYGECYLGDFDIILSGIPENIVNGTQAISDMIIKPRGVLLIQNQLDNGMEYIIPCLHITRADNSKVNGFCQVLGKIIVDGEQSGIELAKGCQLLIDEDGIVQLKNNGYIRNVNSYDSPILIVNGKLIIDDLSQFKNINPENIVFGENGKLIILNTQNDPNEHKVLLKTPNGILNSELYRLFGDRLEFVEFHVQKNTGIKIDEFYEFYSFMEWYNHITDPIDLFEAIEKGYIVWHDGGFIECSNDIIPWISDDTTLSIIGRFFNTYGDDKEKTQEAADKFYKSGSGNVTFRFINGSNINEFILNLDGLKMTRGIYNRVSDKFRLYTDGPGTLYLKNNLDKVEPDTIVVSGAKRIEIENDYVDFNLP